MARGVEIGFPMHEGKVVLSEVTAARVLLSGGLRLRATREGHVECEVIICLARNM